LRKKWRDENKERMTELQANWYQTHKPQVNKRYNTRYKEDICFKIYVSEKVRLHQSINKIKRTQEYVGTSFEQVAEWLEFNFTSDMNWKNHGSVWDIDHVIPVCKWDLKDEKQVDVCFNWKNLSPLASRLNRIEKRANIDKEQLTRHVSKLKEFYDKKQMNKDELEQFIILHWARHLDAGNPLEH
jgi:hypothetical protein